MQVEARWNKRTGEIVRTTWWCRMYLGGSRTTVRLDVPIKGKPPASWMAAQRSSPYSDKGDIWFEKSRADAEAKCAYLQANPPTAKTDDLSVEFHKAYKAQKHKKFKALKIKDLLNAYNAHFGLPEDDESLDKYKKWQREIVKRFVSWWGNSGKSTKSPVHAISLENGKDFFSYLSRTSVEGKTRTSNTIRRNKSHLMHVYSVLCPYSRVNPFDISIKTEKDDETVHREALSQEEIDAVLKYAGDNDQLLYDLIVTGLCTALRRKDICDLRWSSITDKEWEFNGKTQRGSIKVKTHKTGAAIEIPIFPLLGIVLTRRFSEKKSRCPFVFPDAESINRLHYDQLTRRIKKVFAFALADMKGTNITDVQPIEAIRLTPQQALQPVLNAIEMANLLPKTKETIRKCMALYGQGYSYNQIKSHIGLNKSSISSALRRAEEIAKCRFLPVCGKAAAGSGVSALVKKVTQTARKVGMKSGSIYDFPCLRTTFVTLAAKNNVPLETVRLITGHTSTRMLEQYYNRAKGIDFAGTVAAAMPKSFMSDIPAPIAIGEQPVLAPKHERAESITALKQLLSSDQLSKKEKRELMLSLMGSETDD